MGLHRGGSRAESRVHAHRKGPEGARGQIQATRRGGCDLGGVGEEVVALLGPEEIEDGGEEALHHRGVGGRAVGTTAWTMLPGLCYLKWRAIPSHPADAPNPQAQGRKYPGAYCIPARDPPIHPSIHPAHSSVPPPSKPMGRCVSCVLCPDGLSPTDG